MALLLQQKQAIPINFKELLPDHSRRNRATHHIHKYPAKLIPHIPFYFINKFSNENDTILDPFCGSGTTLLESILNGRNALGIELNPIARLIAKVKTTPLDVQELKDVSKLCYKEIKKCGNPTILDFPNRDFWFSKETQFRLAKIKTTIDEIQAKPDIKDFLLVSFSAIIRKVSNADSRDLLPQLAPQPKQANVINEFFSKLDFNIERMNDLSSVRVKSDIIGNDARILDLRKKVNLIITSPPYLSAMEYFRSTKLEYYWLHGGQAESYRELARKTIDSELLTKKREIRNIGIVSIDNFVEKICKKSRLYGFKANRYLYDLSHIMERIYNSLQNDGYCVMVIGNSKILQERIPLNKFLRMIGEKTGFSFQYEMVDEIKFHRFSIKRSNETNRIYNEHILIFKK